MKDLGIMTEIASGRQACPAPVIHAAGVLRCLERQQGTSLMLSSVLAALGYGAAITGRGAFMVNCFSKAAEGLAEDIEDMQRDGVLPPAAADGFEMDPDTVAQLIVDGGNLGLTELIIQAGWSNEGAAKPFCWPDEPNIVDLSAIRKQREG
ncbi:hypothetical protein [Niveispirillum cyanobacteriorum]|uniref:Uncharacterized protein n=1 Tax=Niveispirillum cyanobacteriorum TaxID=1612173 RepID=A0A2K9NDS0_9PROT|nr:hypothetical protein [Niveispirillum cyanobacteriorum]AUN31268.1 hypothetical protein C0V82_14250 [Niveispirillum cyanobacteriorum]GGE72782.1 hypothetical protein GCM10011317_32530 [Niveispirillum cyanobacteriorum]